LVLPDIPGPVNISARNFSVLSPVLADFVAKRFCLLERARLIQDHAPIRNVGSKIHTARFIRFKFIFHSFATETFATKSALSGHIE
jgi:hypothetical protein